MFNAAVFTIAKTKKQPKCPSKDKLIKDLWYIDIMEHYLAIKNNKIIPFGATRMQVEIFIRSEVRKRKKNAILYQLCGIKIWHKRTYIQKRNQLRNIKNRLVVAKGEVGGSGVDEKSGVHRCKLTFRMDKQ